MDKNLEEILSLIKLPKEDSFKFGETALNFLRNSESLHNPANNFEYLRRFLVDEIVFLAKEIEHTRKYAPEIFHPNVSLSREYRRDVYMQILSFLEKL